MMNEFALVIEDDPDLAEIFSKALIAAEYETEVIGDGLAAQNRIPEVTPRLVVLDLHLPNVSGEDLLQQIQKNDGYKNTFIVITTSDALLGDELRGSADLVLIKPVTFGQLRDLASRLHSNQ